MAASFGPRDAEVRSFLSELCDIPWLEHVGEPLDGVGSARVVDFVAG